MRNEKCNRKSTCDDYKYNHCDGCGANKPTGDLISREALKKAIEKYRNLNCVSTSTIIGVRNVMYLIDNAQAVPLPSEQIAWEQGYKAGLAQGKQDRTKGEWIPMNPDCRGYSDYFKCSICGAYIYPNISEKELDYNGCPYCFADMQKGGAE